MKILHIYKDYYPVIGGIENHVRALAEYQVRHGHEVEVLVTNTSRKTVKEERNGVKITKTARWLNLSSAPVSPRLAIELYRRLYRQHPPDIIHLQAPYPVGEIAWLIGSFLPLFGRQRPKTVMTYQSDIIKQRRLLRFYSPFLRIILQRLDKIVASSPAYIQTSPFLRPIADQCRVIPLGIDPLRFQHPDPNKISQIKATYPFKIILFVGRLRYYKSVNYLIEAMRQVENSAHLLVVGVGAMEQAWKKLTADLRLTERVHFVGDIADNDLPAYYAACDVFVLPSAERSEAFGLVLLEAMAAGKPLISTELGTGTSFINCHDETGLVVPPADPSALAVAINKLLADPAKCAEMGNNSRARLLAYFTEEKSFSQLEQLYNELL